MRLLYFPDFTNARRRFVVMSNTSNRRRAFTRSVVILAWTCALACAKVGSSPPATGAAGAGNAGGAGGSSGAGGIGGRGGLIDVGIGGSGGTGGVSLPPLTDFPAEPI